MNTVLLDVFESVVKHWSDLGVDIKFLREYDPSNGIWEPRHRIYIDEVKTKSYMPHSIVADILFCTVMSKDEIVHEIFTLLNNVIESEVHPIKTA
jgi:hypothetical protein